MNLMKTLAISISLGTLLLTQAAYSDSITVPLPGAIGPIPVPPVPAPSTVNQTNATAPQSSAASPSKIITVTSLIDEVKNNGITGNTSLREAINYANQHPAENITILMRPGTYL